MKRKIALFLVLALLGGMIAACTAPAAEKPAEQPAEQATEKPAEQPAEKPAEPSAEELAKADQEAADKETFYKLAKKTLGIEEENIVEFFGAVEHPILYTDCAHHHFHVPVYSRIVIRDPDTL